MFSLAVEELGEARFVQVSWCVNGLSAEQIVGMHFQQPIIAGIEIWALFGSR
jgi:hypothetical protein